MTVKSNLIQVRLLREIFSPVVSDTLCRIGSEGDGGYLVPAGIIESSQGLISLGVSDNWDFEKIFARSNPSSPIHSYDYSVGGMRTAVRFLKKLFRSFFGSENFHSAFGEVAIFIGLKFFFRGNRKFFQNRVVRNVHGSKDVAISDVLQTLKSENLILKCDIEGFEYEILENLLLEIDRFSLLVIEFHEVNLYYNNLVSFLSRIGNSHQLVHLHANNYNSILGSHGIPEVLELTFSQGVKFDNNSRRETLPILDLDSPNAPNLPDFQITFY